MLKRVASIRYPSKGDGGGGDGDGAPRRILQGVQAQVPLRPGMHYPRKGKPLTPI